MSIPKAKAEELVEKMQIVHIVKFGKRGEGIPVSMYSDQCVQCAVIAVEEIISVSANDQITVGRSGLTDYEYWKDVLTELKSMQ